MSFRLVELVCRSPLNGMGAPRRLLGILAGYASDDGTGIYPSMRKLGRECGIPYSTLRRHVASLLASGHLIRVGARQVGVQVVAEYRIPVSNLTLGWYQYRDHGGTKTETTGGTSIETTGGTKTETQTGQSKPTRSNPLPIEQEDIRFERSPRASAHEAPTAASNPFDEVLKAFYRLPSKQLIPQSLTVDEKGELIEMARQHGAEVVLNAIEAIGQKSHKWNRVKPEWLISYLPEAKTEQQKSEDDALWARLQEELRKNPTYNGE